jgi:peptide/nickel transport system permease protein
MRSQHRALIGRLLQILPTLLLIALAVFMLLRLLPGDPATALLGVHATPELIARIHRQLGFDQPLWLQFGHFLWSLLQGDLGMSLLRRVSVMRLIEQRLPVTLYLTGLAAAISVLLAVPLAFVAALWRDRFADVAVRSVFQVGLSTPVFYLGLLLLGLLAARWHLFPVGGIGDNPFDTLYHLFLPAVTLGVSLAAVLMRNLRNAIIGVLAADYIDFARAKGLSPRVILLHHVLRNALMSTVSLFGLNIGTLLGSAVITETVFAVPGVGQLMVESIYGRDYPVVQGLTLALAVLVSLTLLATDLFETWLDPRVRR